MTTYFTHYSSPIGRIRLRANSHGLLALDHVNQQATSETSSLEDRQHPVLASAISELDEYFLGTRKVFQTPLQPVGTEFQQKVWSALSDIPYGQLCTYSDIAKHIGNPKSVRAVGLANSKNPLSIFIPCHRVIGKSGKLTGYAGGLEVKQILLELERGDQSFF